MKLRTAIHFILSFAVTIMLIVCGTAFETRYSGNPQEWLLAHRNSPLLWLLDFTALYTLALMVSLARARKRVYHQAEEIYALREQHNNQLGAIVARASEVEEVNDQQAERLEQLETEALARQEAFETEARHLIEQMFRSLQGQVESHSRQLDAVNLALQYQRAEIAELRRQTRGDQAEQESPPPSRLAPTEIKAITKSFPMPPALETAGETRSDPQEEAPSDSASTPETNPSLTAAGTSAASSPFDGSGETPAITTPKLEEGDTAVFDPTVNARSTMVLETAEFDAFPVASTPPNSR